MDQIVEVTPCSYEPSPEAFSFHQSLARFRLLIWGIKSGKSHAGGQETAQAFVGLPPRSWIWVVGPTYLHLDVAETELEDILFEGDFCDTGLTKRNDHKRIWTNKENGTKMQFKSGDWPDNLRGPNIDYMWIDEIGYLKAAAWRIARQRVTARAGEIVGTTTPPPERTWLWAECIRAGMPPDMSYGEFEAIVNNIHRFVSHFPTWQFPWVPESEIQDERESNPRSVFEQEYGALFVTSGSQVFEGIDKCLSSEKPPKKLVGSNVMGLDLAKSQDWTFLTVMDPSGRVHELKRWQKESWGRQKAKIKLAAKKWGTVIVMDRANVGSVIEDDLKDMGLKVIGVEMNSAQVKMDLIQALQVAVEQTQLKIPDPKAPWSPRAAEVLVDEMRTYQYKETRGGRIGYGAPKGLHDDGVVSLALANWGRVRGAAGAIAAASVAVPRDKWKKANNPLKLRKPRARPLKKIYQRQSMLGSYGGKFWG